MAAVRHGAALVEAKRWNRPLDREGPAEQGIPSTQIMHYPRRAAVVADGKMPWGILTNGRHWRLFYQNALSVAEDFFEIDLDAGWYETCHSFISSSKMALARELFGF